MLFNVFRLQSYLSDTHKGHPDPAETDLIGKEDYVVDPVSGPFFKIQDAIDQAKDDTIIKISSGLYKENLRITNKSISIQAREVDSEVTIHGNEGPTILIQNPQDKVVSIEGLKLTHEGNPNREPPSPPSSRGFQRTPGSSLEEIQSPKSSKKTPGSSIGDSKSPRSWSGTSHNSGSPRNPHSPRRLSWGSHNQRRFSWSSEASQSDDGVPTFNRIEEYHIQFKRLDFSKDSDTVILIKSGQLKITNCKISLKLLARQQSQLITQGITLDKDSTAHIEGSKIVGSDSFNTTGIALRMANLLMINSIVKKHKSGGIMMYQKQHNKAKIFKSRIIKNSSFGVQALGCSESPYIQSCEIQDNQGPGIQICVSNKGTFRKNLIKKNTTGIHLISSDPKILENEIQANSENGVLVSAIEALICQPKIWKNSISENSKNGILCKGTICIPQIRHNQISKNLKAGVLIKDNSGHSTIVQNHIHANGCQGIKLDKGVSAHIERNMIQDNKNANILFGGKNSENTMIIDNRIFGGNYPEFGSSTAGRPGSSETASITTKRE